MGHILIFIYILSVAIIYFFEKKLFIISLFERFCFTALPEGSSSALIILSSEVADFFCIIGSRSASLIRITRSSEIFMKFVNFDGISIKLTKYTS